MVKYSSPQLDRVFQALSDPTRRTIVQRVAEGPKTLTALAEGFPISLPLAMKHLAVLERAGMVRTAKDGRVRTCRFEPEPMREAMDWIRKYEAYWEARLDHLAKAMEDDWEEERLDGEG